MGSDSPLPSNSSVRFPATGARQGFMIGAMVAAGMTACPLMPCQIPPELPTVALGSHRVIRLMSGLNPLISGSHFNKLLRDLVRQYLTDAQVVKYLFV